MSKTAIFSSSSTRPRVEQLEPRNLPSVYTPAQIRHAYGFDQVHLDGTGQTIAIIDAYDDPTIATDLRTFDNQFGLPTPTFFKIMPQGQPPANADWSEEITLDVEWAHAIAPGANLMLVEAKSSSLNDLMTAVNWARQFPTVSVVAMSWGVNEFAGETALDPYFTTPPGHSGVTFLASSGDSGMTVNWPASSPNVVAVGGTTLTLADASGTYGSEKGWSSSGGGLSAYEHKPSYQNAVQGSAWRTDPDVAYDADPSTGVYVYDASAPTPGWLGMGGTSAGVPQWAGLIALADQARAQAARPSLDGPGQTLPALYAMSENNFHDVTTGSNGFSAHVGYDLVTGLGTPRAPAVIAALASVGPTAGSASASAHAAGSSVATLPTGMASDRSGFDAIPVFASTPKPLSPPTEAAPQARLVAASPPESGSSATPAVTLLAEDRAVEGAAVSLDGQTETKVHEGESEPVPAAPFGTPSQDGGANGFARAGAPALSRGKAADSGASAAVPPGAAGTMKALTGLLLLLGGCGEGREELRERRRGR